ncbi:sce7726 family protein [uncultured Clostridium sp.]|uniref:sce7726 family protein n=1 Tax=uncultured Clostridium sp. TaxID=59620 RepID=UPI00280AD773|nr:sce7726 family protein [uncultured Clostridium sp.]
MIEKNNNVLNRIFTQNTFKELIEVGDENYYCTVVKRYLNNIESKENGCLISEIYTLMRKKYRNEYFYKNTLLNKLLLGVHSLNTATALTEVPICNSKADFILINGKAVLYEIKTELDTFDRLEGQINDYYKAFNNVCVVTCESNYKRINSILENTNVGICILTNRNTISTRKNPIEYNSKLNHETMFKVLRKKEFENILLKYYGELPETTQFKYYSACFEKFKGIEIKEVHKYMINELKKRNKIDVEEYNKYVPNELKFIAYFGNYKKDDYRKLNYFLNKKFRG